jgi:hypothetical protein
MIPGACGNFHDNERRLRRRAGLVLLARNSTVDGVDQGLSLDEFHPRPLGLVAIEGCREDFCKGIAIVDHSLARLFQRFKSLAHWASLSVWQATR